MRFPSIRNFTNPSMFLTQFILAAFVIISQNSYATTVQFQTSHGDFEVVLFDQEVPLTVENFLGYVESGAYENSIVHRSIPGFVIQGGGFTWQDDLVTDVSTDNAVMNEPVYSNVVGTIAMAKLGSDQNSATSQWFINLQDNSSNLDVNNGGYAVFGQVVGEGMSVVSAIEDVPTLNFGGPFTNFPLVDYTVDDAQNEVPFISENLVLIYNVVVTDAAVDTLGDEVPALNITDGESSNGGGGAISTLFLLSLISFFCLLIYRKQSRT